MHTTTITSLSGRSVHVSRLGSSYTIYPGTDPTNPDAFPDATPIMDAVSAVLMNRKRDRPYLFDDETSAVEAAQAALAIADGKEAARTDTVAGVLADRAVAAIHAAAAKPSDHREALRSIFFKGSRAYAADNFRAMAVDLPADSVAADTPTGVPADAVRDAVKALGGNRSGPARFVHVERTGDIVELASTAGTTKTTASAWTFPDVDLVFPTAPPVAEVSCNARLLAEMLLAMSKAGVENDRVTLRIHGTTGTQPLTVHGSIPQDGHPPREIDAALMPMVDTKRR